MDPHSCPPTRCAGAGRLRRLVVVLLLLAHGGLLAWSAARHSPAIDEVGHLGAGLSHWHFRRFDLYCVNPPLVRLVACLPLLAAQPQTDWKRYDPTKYGRQEFLVGADFIAANGARALWYFTLARWACLPFSLLGGYVCYRWARDLYGDRAGVLALILWSFCPNVLAHAQLITPDVGAASMGVCAAYLYWRWLKAPGWLRAILAGVALGLAELTKTTWIVLWPLWPVLWAIWRYADRGKPSDVRWPRQAIQLAAVLLVGLYVLNVGYGFDGSFERLGDYPFVSDLLSAAKDPTEELASAGNRFTGTWLARLPVPLPRDYVLGIDLQRLDFEQGHPSYLRGEWRHGGWWYYYLYGLAVKVPLGTWLLVGVAAAARFRRAPRAANWRDDLLLLAPLATVLVLISSQTGFNHHLRYVLPIFPFAVIWTAGVAGSGPVLGRRTSLVVGACLAWSVASSMAVYPHSLSYFNEIAGGPRGGPAHLLDSNVDWGQDIIYLKRWLEEHPEADPLGLAYFGGFDPTAIGLRFRLPPKGAIPGDPPAAPDAAPGPQPGWFAVSVAILHGCQYAIPDGRGGTESTDRPYYAYFQRFRPAATAGYSIYVYHVTPEEANRVRRELGFPELPP